MPISSFQTLRTQLTRLGQLQGTIALLGWDQAVFLPDGAHEARAEVIGSLSGELHERVLGLNKDKALLKLVEGSSKGQSDKAVIVRETWKSYEQAARLPRTFVEELATSCARAESVWRTAREQNKFSLFAPSLEKIIRLKRKEAGLLDPSSHPYDALLETYEPGLRSADLDPLFAELASSLGELLRDRLALQKKQKTLVIKGHFPLREQEIINNTLAKTLGFDMQCGRLDTSTHPFTTNFHPTDVRITTRYRETDPLYAIGSTIHEVGHGLYEQGLPVKHAYTPLAEAVSLGIHESQSRLWENIVGKDLSFWQWFQPLLADAFPKTFKQLSPELLWRHVNTATRSFIRTEADEVTYNLHILVRYRLERALLEGSLRVKDLPHAWNKAMKEHLGVTPPNDQQGVLQDVHWSAGLIGYFPTYTLGNLYASQFFATAEQKNPGLKKQFAKGNFAPLREWLRTEIHQHGKRYRAHELVQHVTGASLSAKPFLTYLRKKQNLLLG
ncbi:carboxypeptidase M32 [Patescibacteria group bacterium]|nr:carboxypeptidase M32 [Patescibacteria group bacterium]